MSTTTPTGIPIKDCGLCGLRHPITRSHCGECGKPSMLLDPSSRLCLTCQIPRPEGRPVSRCHMETCRHWTGDGCVCAVMDIEPEIYEGESE